MSGSKRPRSKPFDPEIIQAARQAVGATLLRKGALAPLEDVIACYHFVRRQSPTQTARVSDAIETAVAALSVITSAPAKEFPDTFDIKAVKNAERMLRQLDAHRMAVQRHNVGNRRLRELVEQNLPLTRAHHGGWQTRFAWICSDVGLGPVDVARAEALAVVEIDPLLEHRTGDPPLYFEAPETAANRWKVCLARFRAAPQPRSRAR